MSTLLDHVPAAATCVRVTVVEADGSSPREAGAAMWVMATQTRGTIGGGALEHQAIARARAMLADGSAGPWWRADEKLALGPALGQCCGGAVRLLYERLGRAEQNALDELGKQAGASHGLILRPLSSGVGPRLVTSRKETAGLSAPVARAVAELSSGLRPLRPALIRDWLIEPAGQARSCLYLYGAGHVGRAVARAARLVETLDVVWVDTGPERFPATISGDIRMEIAADPAGTAALAPAGCYHLIMTYSHAIDLAICHALLQRNDFAFLGLIGSASKKARFLARLRQTGISGAALDRLTCPIGIDGLTGKAPGTIALSAMAQIVREIEIGRGSADLRLGALPA